MAVKKLNKSQKKLVASWNKELSTEVKKFQDAATNLLQGFAGAAAEIFNGRLEILARTELGIDLDEEDWTFDNELQAFVRKEEVKETTVGKKGRAKKAKPKGNTDKV